MKKAFCCLLMMPLAPRKSSYTCFSKNVYINNNITYTSVQKHTYISIQIHTIMNTYLEMFGSIISFITLRFDFLLMCNDTTKLLNKL